MMNRELLKLAKQYEDSLTDRERCEADDFDAWLHMPIPEVDLFNKETIEKSALEEVKASLRRLKKKGRV